MPETGLGQGSDVVLGMIEKCYLTKGSTVSMDNFFSMLPHEKLTDMGMYGVGTIQKKQAAKSISFRKETRQTFDHTWNGNSFARRLKRQQSCHRCHQLFVAKSSFVNKALVES